MLLYVLNCTARTIASTGSAGNAIFSTISRAYVSGGAGSQSYLYNSEVALLRYLSVFTCEVTCCVQLDGAISSMNITAAESVPVLAAPRPSLDENAHLARLDLVYGHSFVPKAQAKRVNYCPLLQLMT